MKYKRKQAATAPKSKLENFLKERTICYCIKESKINEINWSPMTRKRSCFILMFKNFNFRCNSLHSSRSAWISDWGFNSIQSLNREARNVSAKYSSIPIPFLWQKSTQFVHKSAPLLFGCWTWKQSRWKFTKHMLVVVNMLYVSVVGVPGVCHSKFLTKKYSNSLPRQNIANLFNKIEHFLPLLHCLLCMIMPNNVMKWSNVNLVLFFALCGAFFRCWEIYFC